jgi:hypothetical protein
MINWIRWEVNSIRWLEEGREYMIDWNISAKQLSEFAECVSNGEVVIPNTENASDFNPKIPVIVDVEAEVKEQKSVDAGHSPWKLDPVFVAQVFASLLISPNGIVGEYPIAYDDIEITQNDGESAIAVIKGDNTKAERVYLRRFVRKDETGIWSVVGYDPIKP